MTDTEKPMWKRCPGCRQRIFNDPIDWEAHRAYCPAELLRRMQKIERSLIYIDSEVTRVEQLIPTDLDPATHIDPYAVDESDLDDEELDDPEAEDDPDSDTVGDALAAFTPTVPAPTITPIP